MDLEKLKELIQIFEESGLSELEIEEQGSRARLQKPSAHAPVSHSVPVMAPPPAEAPAAPAPAGSADAAAAAESELPTIDSPMVGTYYSAPAPGESAFVAPGDRVDEGQTVCIVEAMKLMNEVGAKFSCVIERVLVENGQPVEFGQPLFAVRPLK